MPAATYVNLKYTCYWLLGLRKWQEQTTEKGLGVESGDDESHSPVPGASIFFSCFATHVLLNQIGTISRVRQRPLPITNGHISITFDQTRSVYFRSPHNLELHSYQGYPQYINALPVLTCSLHLHPAPLVKLGWRWWWCCWSYFHFY